MDRDRSRSSSSVPTAAGVPNATVSGTWTVGAADTCVTGVDGRCAVTSDNLNGKKVGSVTFTVTGVTHATLIYQPSVTSTARFSVRSTTRR